MTYNIKNGGQDDFNWNRLTSIIRIIAAEGPDILVLQELMHAGLDGNRVLHRIENAVGMRAFLGTATTGQHVAVFIPRSARVTKSKTDTVNFHHATVEVTVETTGGPLTALGTHLCPHGGANRLGESQRLANAAKPDRFVLLMGDLNSLDPWQDHEGRVQPLPPHYRARHLMPGSESAVDTRAVATLANAGFIDLFRQAPGGGRDYTAPTERGGGDEFSRMRVDYILATPLLAALATRCYTSDQELCETASDHYPVLAELDLDLLN